jgi:sarcosine oxidase
VEPWPSFIHRDAISHYGQPGAGGLVKLGAHHTGPVTTGDTRSFDVDPPALADLSDYAAEWLPGLDPVPVDATTCLYTSTPTEDFVLDRSGSLVVGAGFSGHGFKFVPEIGRLLAALAAGEPGPGNPFTLGPGRRAGVLGPSGHR